jgi:peptidoglycan-associated lipoprotein
MNTRITSALFLSLFLLVGVSCSSKKDVAASNDSATTPTDRTTAGAGNSGNDSANEFRTVYFDYDSFRLRTDARAALKANIDYLKKNPNVAIQIEGHCDERGSVEYNLALGEKRANATKHFIEKAGVPASRLSIISSGEETSWAKNRRAVFTIVSKNVSQN